MIKNWMAISISFVIATGVSILLYLFLNDILVQLVLDSGPSGQVKTQPPSGFNIKLFILCFTFLFATGCLPFVYIAFAKGRRVSSKLWIDILVLEITGLILAFIASPPDIISKVLVLFLWQLPVLINFICLKKITRKQ